MIGLVTTTAAGRAAAARLAAVLPDTQEYDVRGIEDAFGECDAVVSFLATGATVRLLAPLLTPEGGVLLESARIWLRCNGAWEPAARELGVHRHTLRNRMTAVERALGVDLDDVDARTELWLALSLL